MDMVELLKMISESIKQQKLNQAEIAELVNAVRMLQNQADQLEKRAA